MLNAYYPDFPTGYTHQYSVGFQRELGRNMALEVRYVGNMNYGGTDFQWNLNGSANWNILENGFYNEFQMAQQNLRANIAAGRGNTFAYTGAPGTVAAADLPGLLRRNAAQQRREPEPGELHERELHRLVVVRLAPHLQPDRNDASPAPERAACRTRPATPTPSRPGCRRTSSRSTPT